MNSDGFIFALTIFHGLSFIYCATIPASYVGKTLGMHMYLSKIKPLASFNNVESGSSVRSVGIYTIKQPQITFLGSFLFLLGDNDHICMCIRA